MDNITNLPSCKECNRILKNKDVSEHGLCPKCLAKTADIQIFEVPEELLGSQPTTESTKVEEIEKPLKPGQVIRQRFQKLIETGKITEECIFQLSTKQGTVQFFGVRYPFLITYDGTKTVKEQATINGHVRYGSKPITIDGKEYLVCNDLYDRTVPKFIEWSQTIEQK